MEQIIGVPNRPWGTPHEAYDEAAAERALEAAKAIVGYAEEEILGEGA